MAENFAFCHGLTIDEFSGLRAELTASEYRPVSVRPYSSGEVTKLAVVWTRDAQMWDWKYGTAKEIRDTNDDLVAKGYMPLDVSSWLTTGAERGNPVCRRVGRDRQLGPHTPRGTAGGDVPLADRRTV